MKVSTYFLSKLKLLLKSFFSFFVHDQSSLYTFLGICSLMYSTHFFVILLDTTIFFHALQLFLSSLFLLNIKKPCTHSFLSLLLRVLPRPVRELLQPEDGGAERGQAQEVGQQAKTVYEETTLDLKERQKMVTGIDSLW